MSQWSTHGQPDPLVPFDEGRVDSLANLLKGGSDDSRDVVGRMARLTRDSGRLAWSGMAADAFFEAIGDMPEDLGKLIQSYGMAHAAVAAYGAKLKQLRADSDALLEEANSHYRAIDSLRWQLAAVPLEDEAQRRDLERQFEIRSGDLDKCIARAGDIEGELESTARVFAFSMSAAQDLGIHNRAWYVRLYQDHLEVLVEEAIGAWETLGPWINVAGFVLLAFPPLTAVGLAVLGIGKWFDLASLTLRTVDVMLSDDEFGSGFIFDAGMTAIGFKAGKIAKAFGTVTKVGPFKNVIEAGVEVVKFGDSVMTIMDQVDNVDRVDNVDQVDNQVPEATQQFESPLWTFGRPTLNQFITTPTLIEFDVDFANRSGH